MLSAKQGHAAHVPICKFHYSNHSAPEFPPLMKPTDRIQSTTLGTDQARIHQLQHPSPKSPQSVLPFIGFAMVLVLPAVLPKRVTWVWVWLPNLDTAHNHVPLLRYCRYKQVFQPTIFSQQNQIHTYNYHKYFLQIL